MSRITYPADFIGEDGQTCRIHQGHGLDRQTLYADFRQAVQPPPGSPIMAEELHLTYHPRIKNCEELDGFGCALNGEWHGHWTAVRVNDNPETKFTLVMVGTP